MKTEKSQSELWESIKDLYAWRRGFAPARVNHVFDSLKQGQEAGSETQRQAYEMWKSHGNEEVFFTVNQFRPDESE